MALMVPEDEADAAGPNASLEFGEATKMADLQREAGTLATGGAGAPQRPPPGAMAAQPPQPAPPSPGPMVQPAPEQAPVGPGEGRLDLNAVFPPMPEVDSLDAKPWRQQLRVWAYHPQAGPALKKLASLIENQRGPNDRDD